MDKNTKLPFFANFLEVQEVEEVNGGGMMQTMKFPSDGDDTTTSRRRDTIETMKYPSDSDEYTTMKYPSDSDETVSF